jgi:hypothetical protein
VWTLEREREGAEELRDERETGEAGLAGTGGEEKRRGAGQAREGEEDRTEESAHWK